MWRAPNRGPAVAWRRARRRDATSAFLRKCLLLPGFLSFALTISSLALLYLVLRSLAGFLPKRQLHGNDPCPEEMPAIGSLPAACPSSAMLGRDDDDEADYFLDALAPRIVSLRLSLTTVRF